MSATVASLRSFGGWPVSGPAACRPPPRGLGTMFSVHFLEQSVRRKEAAVHGGLPPKPSPPWGAPWTAVAAATAFRLLLIRQACKGRRKQLPTFLFTRSHHSRINHGRKAVAAATAVQGGSRRQVDPSSMTTTRRRVLMSAPAPFTRICIVRVEIIRCISGAGLFQRSPHGSSPPAKIIKNGNVFRLLWGWPRASPLGKYKLRRIVALPLLVYR